MPPTAQRCNSYCVAKGRDLDEFTVAHGDTVINWPIKSDLENDIQVGITMYVIQLEIIGNVRTSQMEIRCTNI